MSESLRMFDLRNSTDADGNNYYVVFCSRDSEGSGGFPGHAYVVWGTEDSSAAMSSQKAFGFYPQDESATGEVAALFTDIPGALVDDALKKTSPTTGLSSFANSTLSTARLIVQVNQAPFASSQAEVDTWRTADYNLFAKNCIDFVHAVAVDLGLFPPDVGLAEFPTTYLDHLIENSTTALGS